MLELLESGKMIVWEVLRLGSLSRRGKISTSLASGSGGPLCAAEASAKGTNITEALRPPLSKKDKQSTGAPKLGLGRRTAQSAPEFVRESPGTCASTGPR